MLSLILIVLLLSALLYIIYYPPRPVFDFMQRRHPDVLYQLPLPAGQKYVALSLDDCPSPYTEQMLDLLKAYSAHATFFIIGDQVTPSLAPLLNRMVAEGHEMGNHCWTDEKTVLRSLPEVQAQVSRVEKLLPENRDGMKWFRPGGGFFTSEMVKSVKDMGYRTALGCIYPHDPQVWSAKLNARHVLSMVREGGIIILHDRRKWSVEQLKLVLGGLRRGGWEVMTLSQLVEIQDKLSRTKSS